MATSDNYDEDLYDENDEYAGDEDLEDDIEEEELEQDDEYEISFPEKYFKNEPQVQPEQPDTKETFDQIVNAYGKSQVLQDFVHFTNKGYEPEAVIATLNDMYNGGKSPTGQSTTSDAEMTPSAQKKFDALEAKIARIEAEQTARQVNQDTSAVMVSVLNDAGIAITDENLESIYRTLSGLYKGKAPQAPLDAQQLAFVVAATFPDKVSKAKIKVKNPAAKLNKQLDAPEVLKTVASSKQEKKKGESNRPMSQSERRAYTEKRLRSVVFGD